MTWPRITWSEPPSPEHVVIPAKPTGGTVTGTPVSSPERHAASPEGIPVGQDTSDDLTPAEKRAATNARHRAATGFRVGDRVRTNTPRSGRYHNRIGTVIATNLGEVGLSFTASDSITAWFLPRELTKESRG